ncbi:hypothetical protein [Saliphagus infecundisoli]|uniref:Uncharacterized protein n=1 Tax=Saliphagus infecundisoli TaxID=1849069 RepID=A0ABD5QLE1_9EURY|nr:hypothetical protein [Saliphagus infecundisoli]
MKRRVLLIAGVGVLGGCLQNGAENTQGSDGTDQDEEADRTDQENDSNETAEEPDTNATDQDNTANETDQEDPTNGSDHTNESTENMSKSTGNSECSFRVSIIQEVPDGVTVEDANEQLLEFDVIKYAFEHATDPEADHNTVTGRSGDYETFNVFAESDQRFEEVQTALDNFETNRDDDYPPGVYLKYDGTVIAIGAACPT